jgi:hypothetical protein
MMRRTVTAAVVTVVASLVLVGCANRDGSVSATGSTEPAGAGAAPAGGGTDGSTGVTGISEGTGVAASRPPGGDDAPVSSDDAGGSVTTPAQGVDGQVSNQDGGPVPGALVTPVSLDTPSKAIPEVAVFTNDQGRFSWVLPAGRYRITVTADGYQEASAETQVPASGTATLDLRLDRR